MSVAHSHVLDTLDALDDVDLAVDPGWRITHAKMAAAAPLQQPRAALGGRELWTVMDRDDAIVSLTERVMVQRSAARMETDDERLGGWVEVRAHPLPDGGLALQVREIGDVKRAADSSPNDIERRARDALAVAKRRGHGSVVDGRSVADDGPSMTPSQARALYSVLREGYLLVHYQPIFSLGDDAVIAACARRNSAVRSRTRGSSRTGSSSSCARVPTSPQRSSSTRRPG